MPFNRDYTIDPAIFAERPNKPTWNHKESIRKHEIVLIVKNINRTTGEIIRPHELVPGRRPPLPPPTLPPKEIRRKRSLDQFDLRQRRALLDKFPRPPSKDLPDLPPLNLPTGRPENKGGRLVDKPLDQVFGKRLPEPTGPLPHVPPPSLRNNLQVGSHDAVPARDLLPEPPNHRLFINRAAQTLAIAHEAEKRRDHSDRPSHSRSHQRSESNNAALPRATEAHLASVSRTNSYEGHSHPRKASNQTLPDKVLAYYGMEPSEPTRKESPVARSVQVVHQPRGSHRALKPEVDYRNSATLAATLSAGRVPTAAPPAYSSVYSDDSRGSTSSSVTVKASSRGSAAPAAARMSLKTCAPSLRTAPFLRTARTHTSRRLGLTRRLHLFLIFLGSSSPTMHRSCPPQWRRPASRRTKAMRHRCTAWAPTQPAAPLRHRLRHREGFLLSARLVPPHRRCRPSISAITRGLTP